MSADLDPLTPTDQERGRGVEKMVGVNLSCSE